MIVQIDWFQVYLRGLFTETNEFKLISGGVRSKIFANVDKLFYNGKFFGFLSFNPLSKIIPNNAYILKVDNQFLYDPSFENIYFKFKTFCGLKFQNITRLDICTDFNKFLNFRDPENFIKGFFNSNVVYPNKSIFKIIGRSARNPISDYLRFGSNLSTWSVYLYRKSLEMKVVKFKPWIFNTWKNSGIDTTKDVWRLEFSLKGGKHYLQEGESGLQININDDLCFDDDLKLTLFESLLTKYFTFRKNKKGIRINKLKKIQLFPIFQNGFIHCVLAEHEELNRSNKIFIKQLETLNHEVREYNSDLAFKIMEVSSHVAEKTGLKKYREFISRN